MSNTIIIIPTYNELENVQRMADAIMKLPHPFDVLFIDDNSPDGTAQQIEKIMVQYPNRFF